MSNETKSSESRQKPNGVRRARNFGSIARASVVAASLMVAASSCSDSTGGGDAGNGGSAGTANAGSAGRSSSAGSGGSDTTLGGTHSGGMSEAGAAGEGSSEVSVQGDRRIPFTPDGDLAFAEFFIAHHQVAIAMAEHVVDQGASAEVKAMAEKLITDQSAELDVLTAARDALTTKPSQMPADPHADAEMANMLGLSGVALDGMFLLEMIPHHASGLAPAHRAMPYLKRHELMLMSEAIVKAQATEIGKMHAMLVDMGITGAGEDMGPQDPARADMGLLGDRRIPLTPADDVEFIDFFVPHHEMAVMMAEEVIARGAAPEVIAMAQAMKDAQSGEIETLRSAREQQTGSAEPSPSAVDPHAEAEMKAMMKAEGAALDQMFLKEMITHHASALPTSHRAKPQVKDPELRALADAMFGDQAREIGELQMMLEK